MATDSKIFFRSLSIKMMTKAINTFDRATTVVIGVCWCAAFLTMAAAIYGLTLSASTHRASSSALAAEPVLPTIVRKPIDAHTTQVMFDRMQHRFPDIVFSVHGTDLNVSSTNGSRFHEWLTALSYIDTISPELHWSILDLCVGECKNAELMHATLKAERISFETPVAETKN